MFHVSKMMHNYYTSQNFGSIFMLKMSFECIQWVFLLFFYHHSIRLKHFFMNTFRNCQSQPIAIINFLMHKITNYTMYRKKVELIQRIKQLFNYKMLALRISFI